MRPAFGWNQFIVPYTAPQQWGSQASQGVRQDRQLGETERRHQKIESQQDRLQDEQERSSVAREGHNTRVQTEVERSTSFNEDWKKKAKAAELEAKMFQELLAHDPGNDKGRAAQSAIAEKYAPQIAAVMGVSGERGPQAMPAPGASPGGSPAPASPAPQADPRQTQAEQAEVGKWGAPGPLNLGVTPSVPGPKTAMLPGAQPGPPPQFAATPYVAPPGPGAGPYNIQKVPGQGRPQHQIDPQQLQQMVARGMGKAPAPAPQQAAAPRPAPQQAAGPRAVPASAARVAPAPQGPPAADAAQAPAQHPLVAAANAVQVSALQGGKSFAQAIVDNVPGADREAAEAMQAALPDMIRANGGDVGEAMKEALNGVFNPVGARSTSRINAREMRSASAAKFGAGEVGDMYKEGYKRADQLLRPVDNLLETRSIVKTGIKMLMDTGPNAGAKQNQAIIQHARMLQDRLSNIDVAESPGLMSVSTMVGNFVSKYKDGQLDDQVRKNLIASYQSGLKRVLGELQEREKIGRTLYENTPFPEMQRGIATEMNTRFAPFAGKGGWYEELPAGPLSRSPGGGGASVSRSQSARGEAVKSPEEAADDLLEF